jgi:hypothetical protein
VPLTAEERAMIDAALPSLRAELGLPEPPPAPRRASPDAIAAVQRKHDQARAQRLADEATLTRRKGQPVTLSPYDGELNDVQLLRLEEISAANYAAEQEVIAAAQRADLRLDSWDKRTRESVAAESKAIANAYRAQLLDDEADRMKARIVRDADGTPVNVSQAIKVPEPR